MTDLNKALFVLLAVFLLFYYAAYCGISSYWNSPEALEAAIDRMHAGP